MKEASFFIPQKHLLIVRVGKIQKNRLDKYPTGVYNE